MLYLFRHHTIMEDSTNWVLELEEALLDEAPPEKIKILLAGELKKSNVNFSHATFPSSRHASILNRFSGRPLPASLRTDVWSHCLEINGRKSKIEKVQYEI